MSKPVEVVSHWHHSTEDFNTSAVEFYGAVEAQLTEQKAPVKFSKTSWAEGGFFSAKREYLRIEFNELSFELCAAPFGQNYFFSWWLTQPLPGAGCLSTIFPFLGAVLQRIARPTTYYSLD